MIISIIATAIKELLELFEASAEFTDTYILLYLSAAEIVAIFFTFCIMFYLAVKK